jgi:hypothetical protein
MGRDEGRGVMPKESVFGEQHTFDPAEANPKVPVVDVLWGREQGYVQVVSRAEDPHGGRWAGDSTEIHFTDGMHVNLDRPAINKLIRHLRRARDQAFGRDE